MTVTRTIQGFGWGFVPRTRGPLRLGKGRSTRPDYEADDGNRTRVFSLGKAIRCISRWFEKARSSNDATNQEVTSKSRDTPIHRY
jgi:hypothetical protein